jgi:YfiH family protein
VSAEGQFCRHDGGNKQKVFSWHENAGQIPYLLFSTLGDDVKAIFTTRRGGKSRGPYQSLNLGFQTGDAPIAVATNRRLLTTSLGIQEGRFFTLNQVHSDRVVVVRDEDDLHQKRGADADAAITNLSNIVLTCFFADCQGIYLFDPVHRVIALAHAGWRGTVARIAAKCLQLMSMVYGSRAGDCLAALTPAAGICCYEVGEDLCSVVREAFPEKGESLLVVKEDGRQYFSLSQANKLVLLNAGIRENNIFDSELCTICRQDLFFSYRGSGGRTGRMAALFMLNAKEG